MLNFSRPTYCRLEVTSTVRPFCPWGNIFRLSFGRTFGGFQSQSTCGDSKFLALQYVVSFSSTSTSSLYSLKLPWHLIVLVSTSCPFASPTLLYPALCHHLHMSHFHHPLSCPSTFLPPIFHFISSLVFPNVSPYLSSHSLFIFPFVCFEVKWSGVTVKFLGTKVPWTLG